MQKKDLEIKEIAKEVETHGFSFAMKEHKYSREQLINSLYIASQQKIISKNQRRTFLTLIEKELFKIKLEGTKLGVLADTHIGHEKQNIEYIKRAYDSFDRRGITNVLHLGDLLEGYPDYLYENQKQNRCRKELEILEQEYPKGFTNYISFGNHEEQFELVGIDLYKELLNYRNDFIPLGTGYGYVTWKNKKIALKHKTRINQNPVVLRDCDVYLEGHSHFYDCKTEYNVLNVPTCSDVHPNKIAKGKHTPGFLILERKEEEIVSYRYIFENNKPKLALKKILKKETTDE